MLVLFKYIKPIVRFHSGKHNTLITFAFVLFSYFMSLLNVVYINVASQKSRPCFRKQ